ncbi:MAG: hypothetical protein KDE22_04020 [Rhodobacterales bacterium]|nr:hypothetical protein [Rhodobacterales bacterium]
MSDPWADSPDTSASVDAPADQAPGDGDAMDLSGPGPAWTDGANDLFIFGAGDGSDYFNGGEGWTDTVQVDTFADAPGAGGWVLEVDAGDARWDGTEGQVFGDADAAAAPEGDDGSLMAFDNLDTIVW